MYKYVCTRTRTQSGMENTLEFILSYEIFATDAVYIFLHVTSTRHARWTARFEEEIKERETSANYISIVIKHDFNFILSYNLTLMKHN